MLALINRFFGENKDKLERSDELNELEINLLPEKQQQTIFKKKKKKMIVLKSSDNKSFKIEEAVALQSQTIAHMVGDDCDCPKIRLENVTGKTLSKVIEYCNKHAYGDSFSKEDLKQWDAQFMNNIMDHSTIFDLLVAANYLNIKGLLHLTCQTIAQEKKNLEKVIWNYKWILLRPDSTEFMVRDLPFYQRTAKLLERRIEPVRELLASVEASVEACVGIKETCSL